MTDPRDIQIATTLFRGISIKTNDWVYGNPIIRKKHFYIATQDNVDFMTISEEGVAKLKLIEVYPSTLGAYTTMNDSNDIKVFLGDILENRLDSPYINQYRNPVIFDEGYYFGNGFCHFDTCDFKFCNVIGNVYENPELIGDEPIVLFGSQDIDYDS